MEELTCGRRQEQPRHKKWLEKSIPERTGCYTLWQGHFMYRVGVGCSARSHQIEALQSLQPANRNILVGGTSGGVLPLHSCLPAQSVPATATGWHSLLLLGMDVNEVRSCRRGQTAKTATVSSSWAPT